MLAHLIKFLGVGAAATALQYLILIALVELWQIKPVTASTSGYLISAIFNYLMNYYFTFSSLEKHWQAAMRFVVVLSIGLLLTAAAMYLFTVLLSVQYLLAQVITTLLVLIWNFLANRKWTYKAA